MPFFQVKRGSLTLDSDLEIKYTKYQAKVRTPRNSAGFSSFPSPKRLVMISCRLSSLTGAVSWQFMVYIKLFTVSQHN